MTNCCWILKLRAPNCNYDLNDVVATLQVCHLCHYEDASILYLLGCNMQKILQAYIIEYTLNQP